MADIADGRGVPIGGTGWIPGAVIAHWKHRTGAVPERNWIAQHPPLYHLLAAPFLLAVRAVNGSVEMQYRAPRVASALLGAAALLTLFYVLREVTGSSFFAWTSVASLSFIPMFSHMASGTNHDVALVLTGAVVLLYWGRLEREKSCRHGLMLAAALAISAAVKLSSLALALPLLLLSLSALGGRRRTRAACAAAMSAVVMIVPGIWYLRSGSSLSSSRWVPDTVRLGRLALIEYVHEYPVLDHTVRNFVGLIGWTGVGQGEVVWLQISDGYYLTYAVVGFLITMGAIAWSFSCLRGRERTATAAVWLLLFLSAITLIWRTETLKGALLDAWYLLLLSVPVLSLGWLKRESNVQERLVFGSQFVVGWFMSAYLLNAWDAYRTFGQLRATHGRYFFVAVPFLIVALFYPAFLWLRRHMPRHTRLAGLIPLAFAFAEMIFFIWAVRPFYEGSF